MEETKEKKKGCGLIGFIIIVLAVLVLAAVAIPDFLKFQAKAKSREVKTNLGAIFTTHVSYFGEYIPYDVPDSCYKILAWDLNERNTHVYHCGPDEINNIVADTTCQTPQLYLLTENSFTIVAVGNIDDDPECDVWTVNDAKELVNVVNDVLEGPEPGPAEGRY